MNDQIAYLVALAAAPGIGPKRTEVLLKFFKQPEEVWKASDKEIMEILGKSEGEQFLNYRKKIDVETSFELLSKQGIEVLTILQDNYPKRLREISAPPPVIYYKGDLLSICDKPAIAVVGTRMVTAYGREITARLVEGLAAAGLVVVSGLAKGVDTVAHQSAIAAKGKTIAVLGGGLKQIYPAENFKLSEQIISDFGALLTEYPPDQPAVPQNFPARNRIISGLSMGVLVTEAAEGSGSLITADFALEHGREVFAVPGPITSKLSQGPSKLIKMGAKLVAGVEDILEELKLSGGSVPPKALEYNPANEIEALILNLLENEAKSADQLVKESHLGVSQVSATLTLLEIKGVLVNLGTGVYYRK